MSSEEWLNCTSGHEGQKCTVLTKTGTSYSGVLIQVLGSPIFYPKIIVQLEDGSPKEFSCNKLIGIKYNDE